MRRRSNNRKVVNTASIVLFSALFAALTAVGGMIRIPLPLVPVTLQTFFVFLAAGIFGAKIGLFSQCIYLTIGLIGLPVFSGGGGISYVLQPQFGYLLGMPVAALIIGILYKYFLITGEKTPESRNRRIFKTCLIYALGSVIIYAAGILYLSYYTAHIIKQNIDVAHLIWVGCILFIPTDIIKIVAASWLTIKIHDLNIIDSSVI